MKIFSSTKAKFIAVGLVCAFLGIGLGASTGKVVTKEVIREVPRSEVRVETVTKEFCSREADWKLLKGKDDELLTLSASGFAIVSDTFDAISRFDMDTVNRNSAKMSAMAIEISDLAEERQTILKTLGY